MNADSNQIVDEIARLREEHEAATHMRIDRLEQLSERERQVFSHLLRARNTHQIANALGISPKTAEKHRTHIYEKLDVTSQAELVLQFLLSRRAQFVEA